MVVLEFCSLLRSIPGLHWQCGSSPWPHQSLQILPGGNQSQCQKWTWLQDQDCQSWGEDNGTWSDRRALKNTENYIIFLFSIYNIVSFCCSKLLFTVSLALIIEASLEAYFQFWLQSNYSLPDILEIFVAKDFNLKHLVTFRTVSILLSFITITVSIVKIRYINIYHSIVRQNIV